MRNSNMSSFVMISIALAFAGLSFLGCDRKGGQVVSNKTSVHKTDVHADIYHCPMHPQVRASEPGECPICHMKLVKRLSPVRSAEAAEQAPDKKIKYYRNPMDPSVHSDKPAKDSMGMDYIPVYESDSAPKAASDESKDMGRGAFSLTPEQLKLSGTNVIEVEKKDITAEIRVPGRVLSGSRVSFQAFEQDSTLLKAGMEFEAETPTAPGQVLAGKITFVDSILDPMTRTVRVDGAISNSGKVALRTEASVVGKLKVKISNALSIPEGAVLHAGTRDLVYVSDAQGGFSPRAVALGVKASGRYEVKSGLSIGEKISSGPNFLLDSESRIEFSQ